MKLSPDDPRLTALALDELSPDERAALEAELRNSPELRAELEQIRSVAEMLTDELAAEPCPEFSNAQREAIASNQKPANVIHLPRRRIFRTAALTAVAASIMAVLTWQFWFAGTPKRAVAIHGPVIIASLPVTGKTHTANVEPVQPPTHALAMSLSIPVAPTVQPSDTTGPTDIVHYKDLQNSISVTPQPALLNGSQTLLVQNGGIVTFKAQTIQNADTKSNSRQLTDQLAANLGTARPAPIASDASQANSVVHFNTVAVDSQNRNLNSDKNINQPQFQWQLGSHNGTTQPPQAFTPNSRVIVVDPDYIPYRYKLYQRYRPAFPENTASYPHFVENAFEDVLQQPLSTFSADVDGASYANVRRFLDSNRMPPHDAVRIEEMINYFSYDYPKPRGEDPFSVNLEVAGCPWNAEHRSARIGIKGREMAPAKRPPGNFVFLIDISGSMEPPERLPLIKQALRHLVMHLNVDDRVAIVVYANEAGVRLPSTPCSQKEKILEAIDSLTAGGSTNGGDGIQQAYHVAQDNFIKGGVNRVLLCTDGDFNVGMTDPNELTRMIEDRAKDGVFLTTLGVGTDNYKDALMQKLADKGNGNYYYLDSLEEAQRVLGEQMNGTLVTIAKDVKMQVEFNPARVSAYRLLGYEKRVLQKQDFNNDAKDAGEIGAGHTVTALYEIVPVGLDFPGGVDDLKYQPPPPRPEHHRESGSPELLTLKLRYKQPNGDRSQLMEVPLTDHGAVFAKASEDFKFAAAVASFGMLLHDSEFKGNATYSGVEEVAQESKGADESGYRSEFINLVRKASSLQH